MPSIASERLIFLFPQRGPSAPDKLTRSLPAKSTRCIFPIHTHPSEPSRLSTYSVKMECDLEECSFKLVHPTARAFNPKLINPKTSARSLQGFLMLVSQSSTPFALLSLISIFAQFFHLLHNVSWLFLIVCNLPIDPESIVVNFDEAHAYHKHHSIIFVLDSSIRSNNRSTVLGVIPGFFSLPIIVCVFPLPVAPYAKIVAL